MVKNIRSLALHAGVACLLAPVLAAAQQAAEQTAPVPATIAAVRVEGNTLLPEAALAAMTSSLTGGAPDLPALNALAARIQNAYREAGYGGVVAYIPPQESSDGVIVVRVVEGKLAQVRVKGNGHFSSANVRAACRTCSKAQRPRLRKSTATSSSPTATRPSTSTSA